MDPWTLSGAPLPIHGADKHTDVTRYLWIPATSGYIATGTIDQHDIYAAVRGAADSAEPIVHFTFKVPSDFVSFSSLKALWSCEAAAGKKMFWAIHAHYASAGEDGVTHIEYPAYTTTATGGPGILNLQEPGAPLTLANMVKDDFLGLRFARAGNFADDTLNVPNSAFFLGLLFTYIAEQ